MKNLLYLALLCLTFACSKNDTIPDNLEKALGDKELSEYLSGAWSHTSTGKGLISLSETITFDPNSKSVKVSVASNAYETISNVKFSTNHYEIEGSGNYLTFKSSSSTSVNNYRIERISARQFKLYEKLRDSELDPKAYTKTK